MKKLILFFLGMASLNICHAERLSEHNPTACRAENVTHPSDSSGTQTKRRYPFTMAYCLDGTALDTNTGEIYRQNPTLGYITFDEDKITVDNKETYRFRQEVYGIRTYEGNTVVSGNISATPVIFVDENLTDVVLFIAAGNSISKSVIYLMEIGDFQALCNRYGNNMNVGQFIDNSSQGGSSSTSEPSSNRGARFDSRYGYKDCYSCHGTGTCPTCNGRGAQHNSFGLNDSGCANCYRDSNGRRTGKCSTCQGTGKVYGLR